MRRFLTLVCLLCLAIPAGISISGCTRNPAANYCNGLGYGLKVTDVASIDLEPRTTGISLAFGQTRQAILPTASTCKGAATTVLSYTYGTTNNQLVDITPTGNICAGKWNRNSGGGIADYTICNQPNPLPSNNGGLPYGTAYITAAADAITSNPVAVYVHAPVTSISLALPGAGQQTSCASQGTVAQLDAQACYSGTNTSGQSANVLLCAPASVTSSSLACGLPSVNGTPVSLASIPSCSTAIGTLSYTVGNTAIASINSETNQITAEQPGTTVINASVAGSGSSAGFFSTCPPASISVTLANGATSGTVTQGATQNLVTTVKDTNGSTITGLTLDYQSTDPIDISASSAGVITTSFAGEASVYAVCQPDTCNPAPINELGIFGTGLSLASNPVTITTPGTASDYLWFSAPGQSQYVVPVELLSGTVGSTVRLPYVPNSMVMDRLGANLYFGSSHELTIFATSSNSITKQDTSVPGVVLAASPDSKLVLINDQVRQLFYLYSVADGTSVNFGGLGNAAAWTPDAQTVYVTDSAALGGSHTNTLYVYNVSTGWTSCSAGSQCAKNFSGAQNLAITIPAVGAYFSGSSTVSRTWCPTGTVGNYTFYPQGDLVPVKTDVLAATTDGKHILGATLAGSSITLSDIGVTVPTTQCTLAAPLTTYNSTLISPVNASSVTNATAVNQVVASPASNLAFITYTGSTPSTLLPYYIPGSGAVSYVSLKGSAASTITAPITGAFSPDNSQFFVSTAGDNMIHYISVPTLTDTKQIAPNLPACTPGSDPNCTLSTAPASGIVPAAAIAVKPRSTT